MVHLLIMLVVICYPCFSIECASQELPPEILTIELVKHIINNADTRNAARHSLTSYALVNNTNHYYIKNNNRLIENLLDKRFPLTLDDYGSGDYQNTAIKEQTIQILQGINLDQFKPYDPIIHSISQVISAIRSNKVNDLKFYDFTFVLQWAHKTKNYVVASIMLGAIKSFSNRDYQILSDNDYTQLILEYIASFKNVNIRHQDLKIFELYITIGKQLFGSKCNLPAILDHARKNGTTQFVTYLESISKA